MTYHKSCVATPFNINRTSTFLTKNIFAIMYNAASEKGHSNIVAGLDEYNENITRYCFDGMSSIPCYLNQFNR